METWGEADTVCILSILLRKSLFTMKELMVLVKNHLQIPQFSRTENTAGLSSEFRYKLVKYSGHWLCYAWTMDILDNNNFSEDFFSVAKISLNKQYFQEAPSLSQNSHYVPAGIFSFVASSCPWQDTSRLLAGQQHMGTPGSFCILLLTQC